MWSNITLLRELSEKNNSFLCELGGQLMFDSLILVLKECALFDHFGKKMKSAFYLNLNLMPDEIQHIKEFNLDTLHTILIKFTNFDNLYEAIVVSLILGKIYCFLLNNFV